MVSKIVLSACLLFSSAYAKGESENPPCRVHFHLRDAPYPFVVGHSRHHTLVSSWDNKITIAENKGADDCYLRMCKHPNFGGQCTPMVSGGVRLRMDGHWANSISSFEIFEGLQNSIAYDRRRAQISDNILTLESPTEDGLDLAPAEELADPLCEALYIDMKETKWEAFSNSTIKHWEMERLIDSCDTSYSNQEEADQCKFYVYAVTETLDDEEILSTLEPKETANDMMAEYQRCGLLNVKINSMVESGGLSGVEIVEKDGEDYFMFEEPIYADSVGLVEHEGALSAVVSAGSLLAMWIGTTLVKVCRDFDPQTGAWLLA